MFKVNKRVVSATVVVGVMAFSLTGCFGDDTGTKASAQKNEQQQASSAADALIRNQPVHSYQTSQLRQNLQEIEDAQANGTVTTTFFMQMGRPDPLFSCPSVGAPIASSSQLTNPEQTVSGSNTNGYSLTTIQQMDPTGQYTGSSTGTYVMCVGADGSVTATYWEGEVFTVFATAHWDQANHKVEMDGPPSFKFSPIKKK